MRNVIYAINVTIDGCFGHTDFGHTETIADEEVSAYSTQLIRDADLLVFGQPMVNKPLPTTKW